MTGDAEKTTVVAVERVFAHPVERVWRALSQPEILAEWLLKNDFRPEVGHRFKFSAEWGDIDCKVLEVEPHRRLAYKWSAFDVETVVTFTLEPISNGTRLRMEQVGFRPDQKQARGGAKSGWSGFFDDLQDTLDSQ
jgi:uncharacterized protein YndB with AHSA1/START domain